MIWDDGEAEKKYECNSCSRIMELANTLRYSGNILCRKCFKERYPELQGYIKKERHKP